MLFRSSIYIPGKLIELKYLATTKIYNALCYLLLNLFYNPRKTQKRVKFITLSLNRVSLFIPALLFFSLNNTKKKLCSNIPEMFRFNPEISIQKCPIICGWYKFFSANVSDFYAYFTAENRKLEASYLYEKLSCTNTF